MFILKYFFFFGIIIAPVNYLVMKPRINKYIAANPESKAELEGFLKKLMLVLIVGPAILGILQLLNGSTHPFFMLSPNYADLTVLLAQVYMVLGIGFAIYWVAIKGGAEFFAKYNGVLGNLGDNEVIIKVFVVFLSLAGLCVFLTAVTMNVAVFINF